MEKEYFYVKPDDFFDLEETIYKVDIDDINSLASLALTLEAEPEVKESFGYAAALSKYFHQNQHILSDCYKKIESANYGRTFLCVVIDLLLSEKQFRNSGLTEAGLTAYSKYIEMYQHELKFNKTMYNQEDVQQRKK